MSGDRNDDLITVTVIHESLRGSQTGVPGEHEIVYQFLRQLMIGGGHHDGEGNLIWEHHEGNSDKDAVCNDLIKVTVINETTIGDERGTKQ